MTTLGELIETLYAKYEREYQDAELASGATQRDIEQILESQGLTVQVAE